MRAALLQMTASDDPEANLPDTRQAVADAAGQGAELILTPEVTNCVSASRTRQNQVLRPEAEDATLAALREDAARLGVWLNIGSLALKTDDPDGRFANRSFLIGPTGEIAARYDKIHMFDVVISETESYRESAGYRPGDRAVLAETPVGRIGLTICYDIRFPHLYRQLAQAGADILLVPSAFSAVTGAAHWESLLRARAIETGCFVLAAAQTGTHPATRGKARQTYGHSLAVAPWGEVLADAGEAPGVTIVDLDLAEVASARSRVPSLDHDRTFEPPA
ncbi:carbon-nitrogen hydrolase family protein [Psychromarinibacter sp. C21-152]|uniref:Carbon-nitrogen hydrolase family protein n=1 Tax=Psychromarinibacter sediminicola TaxID=3033385 RepID=A0AAE3T8N5_9RHOB|nr:carbon-nitrogen hydrolase family protein [Psychromarinibacter sediminicola]MDF0601610.1 carbon-nitrogen hydrolase family protein [Psychromarinibacter sediminicola]